MPRSGQPVRQRVDSVVDERGAPLVGHTGAVFSLAWSADGSTLLSIAPSAAGSAVRVFDIATGEPVTAIQAQRT